MKDGIIRRVGNRVTYLLLTLVHKTPDGGKGLILKVYLPFTLVRERKGFERRRNPERDGEGWERVTPVLYSFSFSP